MMHLDVPDEQLLAIHDRNVSAVTDAVASLLPAFASRGMTPTAILEGAVKGAAVAMLTAGDSLLDVADVLEEMAECIRSNRAKNTGAVQ